MYRQVNEDKATVDPGYMLLITGPWQTLPQTLQMVYWEVWDKRILYKPVTSRGEGKEEKNGAQNTKTDSTHTYGGVMWAVTSQRRNF